MGLLEGHQRWVVGDERPVHKRFPAALEAVLWMGARSVSELRDRKIMRGGWAKRRRGRVVRTR